MEITNIQEMGKAIKYLNELTYWYDLGEPLVSDLEYDNLYFKLQEAERKLGIVLEDSPTAAITYEVKNELTKVTHNHPEGIKGAQAVACTIWAIRNGYTKDDIKEWLESECKYNLDKTYDELKRTHKFECICQNSVPAAFICWYNSTSYEDCVRKAVSLGGDADTEAAIAGAFAAADPNTPVPEELTNDVTRFFSMDFMDVLKSFHEKCEK